MPAPLPDVRGLGRGRSRPTPAGAAIRFRRWTEDAIRDALAAYWTRTGHPLTADDLHVPDWRGPTASTLRRRYGSVERAWEAFGPVPA